MAQEVQILRLQDLVLWTENPRDPIDPRAADQDIVDLALVDGRSKWSLPKLAKEMGPHYDFSELPTVVFHGKTPVVYDGNRRVILGKIKHGLVTTTASFALPGIPDEIPCNVCSKSMALQNVLRKHAETGSWLPLERDIFLHKHMGEPKSLFLLFEEATGMISAHHHLNQRFVKEEILNEETLKKLGFSFVDGKFLSKASATQTADVLADLSTKVESKTISTRHNRGNLIRVLDPVSQRVIDENKKKSPRPVNVNLSQKKSAKKAAAETIPRQSKRIRLKPAQIFGGALYLKIGAVSNLYRDIVDLHEFYSEKKGKLSDGFPNLIRMALRLLVETAAKESKQELAKYVISRFPNAKNALDADTKTTLSNQNVKESSIVQLLQNGAHAYSSAANLEQTLALSIIVGAIVSESHGQGEAK